MAVALALLGDAPGKVDGLSAIRHEECLAAPVAHNEIHSTASDTALLMSGQPQPQHVSTQPQGHAATPVASQKWLSTTTAGQAPEAKPVPSPIKPSRRIRKPPPRWCEDPLATAELGGSAVKLQEVELQRRQTTRDPGPAV